MIKISKIICLNISILFLACNSSIKEGKSISIPTDFKLTQDKLNIGFGFINNNQNKEVYVRNQDEIIAVAILEGFSANRLLKTIKYQKNFKFDYVQFKIIDSKHLYIEHLNLEKDGVSNYNQFYYHEKNDTIIRYYYYQKLENSQKGNSIFNILNIKSTEEKTLYLDDNILQDWFIKSKS